MFGNGAETVLVDFHMHTHRDKEFSFDGEDNSFIVELFCSICAKTTK